MSVIHCAVKNCLKFGKPCNRKQMAKCFLCAAIAKAKPQSVVTT